MSNFIPSYFAIKDEYGHFASQAYFECNTAADVAEKIAVNPDSLKFTNDSLSKGITVRVKFTNTNTATAPLLKVGNSDSFPIQLSNSTTPGISPDTSWSSGSVLSFTYDGSSWRMNDFSASNSNLIYCVDVTSISPSSIVANNDSYQYSWKIPIGLNPITSIPKNAKIKQFSITPQIVNWSSDNSNSSCDFFYSTNGIRFVKNEDKELPLVEADLVNSAVTRLAKVDMSFASFNWAMLTIGTNVPNSCWHEVTAYFRIWYTLE